MKLVYSYIFVEIILLSLYILVGLDEFILIMLNAISYSNF